MPATVSQVQAAIWKHSIHAIWKHTIHAIWKHSIHAIWKLHGQTGCAVPLTPNLTKPQPQLQWQDT